MVRVIVAMVLLTMGAACAWMLSTPTPSVARIEEDSPEWNCQTMGNCACGSTREAE